MKRLLLAGAALGVLAAALPASAADLRPLYKAPPPALASWAGFYIGANAGGGTATGDFLDMDCLVCADVTFHRGFGEVGGQIGYNWQWGPAVVGVEGDLNWTNATGTRWFALDTQAPGTNQFRFDAFGSIRARAGLAFDRTLIYVTAGPAWGHFNSTTTLGGLVGPIQDVATDNTWHPGVAVGAGAEFKLAPNWSLRGEYLFLDFADRVVNFVPTPSGRPAQAQLRESFGYSAQVARVGLNYWFDAGAAAATSAYAADYRAPIYKAPVAAALPVSWAGFYLGVNAGGGMADAKFLDPDCFTCADVTFHRGFGEAGGQAGYNWQSGAAVLGLEGDLNWASVNESGVLGLPPGFGNAQFGTTQFKLDAFATLRARAGLAVDRALVYVTAGPAWGHFNSVTTTHIGSLAGPVRDIFADDGWHAGLAVGAGAEYMLAPHWLVRAEYLHLAFTDRFVNAVPVNGPATDALTRVNYSYSAHVARLGLSYKLDDGLASAYPSALPTPMYKAPPAPAVSWAGLYIGVNAGGGIANADAWDMDCFTCTNVTVQRGFAEVGGQVGYNWQWASTVLGVEGDLNWASVNESVTRGAFIQNCCLGTSQFKFDAFGSVRARLGLAADRALFYVTAGPAFGHFNSAVNSFGPPRFPDVFVLADNSWHLGAAVGAGMEYMVAPGWSIRGEYLYLNFVERAATCVPLNAAAVQQNCASFHHIDFANSAQIARVGLNYKLDWLGPVVAKY